MVVDPLFDRSDHRREYIDRVERRPREISDIVSVRWLMEMEVCVMRVRVAIPAALPSIGIHRLDVVQREVTAGEQTDIQPSGLDCRRIPALLAQCIEGTRLVATGTASGSGAAW